MKCKLALMSLDFSFPLPLNKGKNQLVEKCDTASLLWLIMTVESPTEQIHLHSLCQKNVMESELELSAVFWKF